MIVEERIYGAALTFALFRAGIISPSVAEPTCGCNTITGVLSQLSLRNGRGGEI